MAAEVVAEVVVVVVVAAVAVVLVVVVVAAAAAAAAVLVDVMRIYQWRLVRQNFMMGARMRQMRQRQQPWCLLTLRCGILRTQQGGRHRRTCNLV